MNWDNVKHLTIDGKSAVRLAIGEGVLWKGLPSGYTRLDYIETNGTQYIDTGCKADQDSRICCEIMWMGEMHGFGARSSVHNNNFSVRVVNSFWQLGYGGTGNNDGVSTGIIEAKKEWQTIDINKNELYVDGEFSVSSKYKKFETAYTLALGAIKASSVYYGKAKYRTCQIYDNGKLVRDFIPCRNPSGEPGMYDTVNAKFYGNAGTGEIVAGAEL